MLLMRSLRALAAVRWMISFGALAGIVLIYRRWLHVNPTTVALTLLLYVLLLAARWPLRVAAAVSVAATILYNFYFLPPIGAFTIADPQNWLALFAFLATSIVGSRLSQSAREEAQSARTRQGEMELLFTLSREILQTGNIAELVSMLPHLIRRALKGDSAVLYLLNGDHVYRSGVQANAGPSTAELRERAARLTAVEITEAGQARIPLREGTRPRGLLLLNGLRLPAETFQAIGGLVSIALDRAQALEDAARSEAGKESERLRALILDSITHELRTPLTSIKGAASALLSTAEISAEDRRELLTIVDEEADRLNRLVSKASEMAQIEAYAVQMHFTPVAPLELVEAARESCAWVFSTHPVRVNLPDLPKVSADAAMVSKVIANLLENAGKYSLPGSPITVSGEQRDGCVLLKVADCGIGIAPAEQGLIFDRLYRANAQYGSTPGTGMGLAISRAIAERHHGSLTVTSQPEQGSVFTFSLPLA